jgi:hypothetical protein
MLPSTIPLKLKCVIYRIAIGELRVMVDAVEALLRWHGLLAHPIFRLAKCGGGLAFSVEGFEYLGRDAQMRGVGSHGSISATGNEACCKDNQILFGRQWVLPVKSGRLENRVCLAVPVEISSLQDPSGTERTTTENVCSLGVRVLMYRARERNERLIVKSLAGDLRALARVVYCQRLPDGRFGVGLQFRAEAVDWSKTDQWM